MRYFATFISGTQEIIKQILQERFADLEIVELMDGAVEFETKTAYANLHLYCMNNIFLVLDKKKTRSTNAIEDLMRQTVMAPLDKRLIGGNSTKMHTFRIVTSFENQLVSVNKTLKQKLEKVLAKLSKLQVEKSKSDVEFWFLFRSEGVCYFLKRLTKHTAYDKILAKGELHPELAYMMCKLSQPKHTDVVLDPFCGSGAIPFQRCKKFPFSKILAFDVKKDAVATAKKKLKNCQNVSTLQLDVENLLSKVEKASVDAIITDPPWGVFEELKGGVEKFYAAFVEKFKKVLKDGGHMIVLTAKKEEFTKILSTHKNLKLLNVYNILVSGKKAAIYQIKKLADE